MLDTTIRAEAANFCADRRVAGTLGRGARRPVLIVLHQPQSNPGRIGRWLRSNGYALDIRRPAQGAPLPGTLAHHSAAVIFGGPMSANDEHEFLRRERELIGVALREGRPLLGVCLGAQLMARSLGARVYKDCRGRAEIGYYPVRPTPAGRAICDWPGHMYQWHVEGFELPAGATLLATADGAFVNQAFAYGQNAVGIQFHPEVTLALLHGWTTRDADHLDLKGALPRAQHIAAHIRYCRAVGTWLDGFLGQWVEARLPVA